MKMRKWLVFLLVLGVFMSTMITGYAESGPTVEKVVFRNLNTSDVYLGLGGIRFYNEGVEMDSGSVITSTLTSGETTAFNITSSSTYDNPFYNILNAINTSVTPTGGFPIENYWISELNAPNEVITIDFKTPLVIDEIGFVPSPNNGGTSTTEPFVIDVYATNGSMISYDITPITQEDIMQKLILNPVQNNLTLDIEATTYDLNAGDTVDVDIKLSNATDIYAEDFTIQYDPTAFELVSEVVSDASAYQIMHTEKTSGQARYIVASNGAAYGITGESNLIKITFKAKNFDGTSEINVFSGLVADSSGIELTPDLLGKTFTIVGGITDVNGDENFTLGDLAIASNLLTTVSSEWGVFTPDVDINGTVEVADLNLIVTEILK